MGVYMKYGNVPICAYRRRCIFSSWKLFVLFCFLRVWK